MINSEPLRKKVFVWWELDDVERWNYGELIAPLP